jgi:hypothetical protein
VALASSIEEVRGDGLPWPAAFAGATVFTQLVGGCLVATGFFAWLGALVLAGFTVAATLVGHRFWLRRGAKFRHELTTSLEHVAIVGGLLLLSDSISLRRDKGSEMSDQALNVSAAQTVAGHPPLSVAITTIGRSRSRWWVRRSPRNSSISISPTSAAVFRRRRTTHLGSLASYSGRGEISEPKQRSTPPGGRSASLFEVDQATANLAYENQQLVVIDASEEVAKARVGSAEAALLSAKFALADTPVWAPIDGIVANRKTRAGEYVTEGTRMPSIVPINNLWVEANYRETQVGVGRRLPRLPRLAEAN